VGQKVAPEIYHDDCVRRFGEQAGSRLAPILSRADREGWLNGPDSPECFPYDPRWGRINEELKTRLSDLLATIEQLSTQTEDRRQRSNLDWLAENFGSTILLDEVSRGIELADNLSTPAQWRIPTRAPAPARGYLLIWADGDVGDSGLHANFQLAAALWQSLRKNPDFMTLSAHR
jgi:hypothetical protein